MSWNHRVLVTPDGDDYWYEIHEVYYDDEGKPNGHTARGVSVSAGNLHDMHWKLEQMENCLDKPFLWGDDRFPQEFKEEDKK